MVSEIALVVIAVCKGIAKTGQHIVNLCRPDSDVFAKRNVDTSADNEVKRIVARRLAQGSAANGNTILVQISVKIAVCSTEHSLNKWFEMRSPEFYDGTNVVGEEISLSGCSASIPSAIWWRYCKVVRIAAIALKLRHNSDVLAEVKSA